MQFGTHAQAIYEAYATRLTCPTAPGGYAPLGPQGTVGNAKFQWGTWAQTYYEASSTHWTNGPAAGTTFISCTVCSDYDVDPRPPPQWVTGPVPNAPVIGGTTIPPMVFVAEQFDPTPNPSWARFIPGIYSVPTVFSDTHDLPLKKRVEDPIEPANTQVIRESVLKPLSMKGTSVAGTAATVASVADDDEAIAAWLLDESERLGVVMDAANVLLSKLIH